MNHSSDCNCEHGSPLFWNHAYLPIEKILVIKLIQSTVCEQSKPNLVVFDFSAEQADVNDSSRRRSSNSSTHKSPIPALEQGFEGDFAATGTHLDRRGSSQVPSVRLRPAVDRPVALYRQNAAEYVWLDGVETPDGALAGHRCILLSIVYMQR